MDEKSTIVAKSESSVHENLLTPGLRLTPTGKISHAKTRVYTQRYRTEWEQMPDFKGWLTSVPYQPTRAYCTYCKKNLHAHRLSLLKHTCTMKHQRAALLHEAEEKKKLAVMKTEPLDEIESEDVEDVEGMANPQIEIEENEEEIEYIIERLETDDELEESQMKGQEELDAEVIEDEEEEVEDDEGEDEEGEDEVINLQDTSDEYEVKPMLKKMKIEPGGSRDTLAEAMAHVHGEYLDDSYNQEEVQMEMIMEGEDQHHPEVQVVTVLREGDDLNKLSPKDARENGRSIRRSDGKIERRSSKVMDDSKSQDDSGIVVACPLPILGTAYQINTSSAPTSNTIGVLQPVNTIPIASAQNKTITLSSGKTITVAGGSFQPGAQYVLINQGDDPTKSALVKKEHQMMASTSQQTPKKHLLLKPVKSSAIKKPRISTHVVDTCKGLPVGGLPVSLYRLMDGRWTFLNESNTNPNGRCIDLVDNTKVNFTAGRYKIHFDVDKYFTLRKIETMYPFIEIVFDVKNPIGHYHIPVLLSPFGYTTYRGSERVM